MSRAYTRCKFSIIIVLALPWVGPAAADEFCTFTVKNCVRESMGIVSASAVAASGGVHGAPTSMVDPIDWGQSVQLTCPAATCNLTFFLRNQPSQNNYPGQYGEKDICSDFTLQFNPAGDQIAIIPDMQMCDLDAF